MYAAQKKCWNQRKLPRHSLIIISSFTAVDLDYTANLMPMIRSHCVAAGYPELNKIAASTVWLILNANEIKPHRMRS